MVGDVNMFLPDGLDGDGESEIMIACTSLSFPVLFNSLLKHAAASQDRGKGYGPEALDMMSVSVYSSFSADWSPSLSFAVEKLPITPSHLIARIRTTNTPSICLFSSLGFGIVKLVPVFHEVELRFGWDAKTKHPG